MSFQKCGHLRAAVGDEPEDRQACFLAFGFYELTQRNGRLGSALTFTQMLFISTQALPTFLTFTPFPTLRPRHIPIHTWLYQVLIITSTGLLNNWAYAFNVPFTILIVFRSAGMFPPSFHWPHI
jgi:solute carrier family 35 (UDP-xylose/UDP-N-acetylglucosamine transporter), member B4